MIVNQKNSRRVLSVAGLIISLVQYIMTVMTIIHRWMHPAFNGIWILFLLTNSIVFGLDFLAGLCFLEQGLEPQTFKPFCSFWATNLVFQILQVACLTWTVWIDNDLMADVMIILTLVKFALFVVILVLSIISYRKGQTFNDTVRYSNAESAANVVTNINDRGQVAIVGRRPQNQDYHKYSNFCCI